VVTCTFAGQHSARCALSIGSKNALAVDRYLRARRAQAQAWRPELWLGDKNRGPLTPRTRSVLGAGGCFGGLGMGGFVLRPPGLCFGVGGELAGLAAGGLGGADRAVGVGTGLPDRCAQVGRGVGDLRRSIPAGLGNSGVWFGLGIRACGFRHGARMTLAWRSPRKRHARRATPSDTSAAAVMDYCPSSSLALCDPIAGRRPSPSGL
jgi:hypothetical protein